MRVEIRWAPFWSVVAWLLWAALFFWLGYEFS